MGSKWFSKGLYSNLLFGKISTPPNFSLIRIVYHLTPIGKFQCSFQQILLILIIIIIIIIISNSNWTEWSTIERIISKSDKCKARSQFENTSTITPWIVRHKVQLLVNCIYNKFQKKFFWELLSENVCSAFPKFENCRKHCY